MEIPWLYIALLSPALFALVVIIDDNLLRDVYRSPFFGAIISGFFSLLSLFSLFFIDITIPSTLIIALALFSGVLTVSYYLLYFKALSVEAPSVVIALFFIAPAVLPFLAFLFLGEVLTNNQYVGFAVILIASFALSIVDIKKFKFSPALVLVLIAAFFTVIIALLNKYIYTEVDFWSGYIFYSLGMGLGALLLATLFPQGRAFRKDFNTKFKKWIWVFVLVELIGISAELTYNYALSKGPASIVKVLEGVQPMYMLLFAILFYPLFPTYLREAIHGNKTKKFVLMGLILIGLYFINKG